MAPVAKRARRSETLSQPQIPAANISTPAAMAARPVTKPISSILGPLFTVCRRFIDAVARETLQTGQQAVKTRALQRRGGLQASKTDARLPGQRWTAPDGIGSLKPLHHPCHTPYVNPFTTG